MDWEEVRKNTDNILFYLLSVWQLDSKHKPRNAANTVSKGAERANDVT